LWVETQGTGSIPVVMLHAGVADRRMWRDQMAALGPDFCAVAYDRRGFGLTEHADEPYSHVTDLLAVLDAVAPAQPAILVGCSQGGRIAIDTVLAVPGRAHALVLVAPAISGAPEPTRFPPIVQALIEELAQAEQSGELERVNALEAHAWLDGPEERRGRFVGPARELFLEMNRVALRAQRRGAETEPPAAFRRAGEIALPALLLWGDRDFPHVIDNCRYLATTLPNAQTHVMAGVAHLPNLERPAEFNRRLVDFCSKSVR
jgi:pimeloyl-ACP methyl ester carboxylesterase